MSAATSGIVCLLNYVLDFYAPLAFRMSGLHRRMRTMDSRIPEGDACERCGLFGHGTRDCSTCRLCGKWGHVQRDCPQRTNKKSTSSSAKRVPPRRGAPREAEACFVCGEHGHRSVTCREAYGAGAAAIMTCFFCKQRGHLGCGCPQRIRQTFYNPRNEVVDGQDFICVPFRLGSNPWLPMQPPSVPRYVTMVPEVSFQGSLAGGAASAVVGTASSSKGRMWHKEKSSHRLTVAALVRKGRRCTVAPEVQSNSAT